MIPKIIITNDGSHTILVEETNLTYHSKHGAIQESMHVFIEPGLKYVLSKQEHANIFEMGFGTGLNALLTVLIAEKEKKKIYYQAIELFPLGKSIIEKLNYCHQLNRPDLRTVFEQLHSCNWEKDVNITPYFTVHKTYADLTTVQSITSMDLIYFDAFDPAAQPGLWTEAIFKKLFRSIIPGGVLMTYSSKGTVRRALQSAGFTVEKLPGPKGKKEIIRAVRSFNT